MDFFGSLLVLYLIYFFAVYFFVDILKLFFTICLWLLEKIMDGASWSLKIIFTVCLWPFEKIIDGVKWLWPWFVRGMKWIWFWSIRRIKALFSRKNSRSGGEEAPSYKEKEAQRKDEEQTRKEDTENRHREEEARKKWEEASRQQQRQQRQNTTEAYAEALILLGLEEEFTHKNFKRAYRRAIMAAHPDRGGTKEKAQAVNKARGVINKHKGW